MIRISLLLLLGALLLLPLTGLADDDPWATREQVVFGMPYIGHAVQPERRGLINAILKAVYEGVNIDFVHKRLPYVRALEKVKDGRIDCTLDVSQSRTGVLHGTVTMTMYDLAAAHKHTTGFQGVESLADQRVAYLHGFGIARFLSVKVKPQLVYDLSSAFHMLDRDSVAFILGDDLLLRQAMMDSNIPSGDFVITNISTMHVHPIFTKSKEGQRLRDIYDRRMTELLTNGELVQIFKAHGLSQVGINKVLRANGLKPLN